MFGNLREHPGSRVTPEPQRTRDRARGIGGREPAWLELDSRALGVARISRLTLGRGTTVLRHFGDPGGGLTLLLPVRGRIAVKQDRRTSGTGPGGMVLLDGTRPYRVVLTGPQVLVAVQVEHGAIGLAPDGSRHLTAIPLTGPGWLRSLSVDTFTSLAENLDGFETAAAEALGLTVARLVSGLVAERLSHKRDDPAAGRQLLLLRVLHHTADQLGDSSLIPARIAAHFGVSLRHLQVLFAELGTSPARWIRDERLTRLHADLTNPRFGHLTVATLGENWGMVGASQVSRLFRARYGVTPSEFRRQPPAAAELVSALLVPAEFDLENPAGTACAEQAARLR